MSFNIGYTDWYNETSVDLNYRRFTAGDSPPAATFNYFFKKVIDNFISLDELFTEAGESGTFVKRGTNGRVNAGSDGFYIDGVKLSFSDIDGNIKNITDYNKILTDQIGYSDLVKLNDDQILTQKTIDGNNNTISNIQMSSINFTGILDTIKNLSTNGLFVKLAGGLTTSRKIESGNKNVITIDNGDFITGNATINLSQTFLDSICYYDSWFIVGYDKSWLNFIKPIDNSNQNKFLFRDDTGNLIYKDLDINNIVYRETAETLKNKNLDTVKIGNENVNVTGSDLDILLTNVLSANKILTRDMNGKIIDGVTIEEIQNGYAKTTEVSSAISTAMTGFINESAIDTKLVDYAKTSEVTTAISGALTDYAKTTEIATSIATELTDYIKESEVAGKIFEATEIGFYGTTPIAKQSITNTVTADIQTTASWDETTITLINNLNARITQLEQIIINYGLAVRT